MPRESTKWSATPLENRIPTGLSGGFFIYNALGRQEIFFADENVIALFECRDMDEFRQFTHNSFIGMVHPDDLDRVENDIAAQTFNCGKRHDYVRYRILTRNGAVRYIEDFGHLLHNEEGQAFFCVYIVDVQKEEYYQRGRNSFAESQVFHMQKRLDSLTGLLNMTAFYENAQEALLNRAAEGQKSSCVVLFDILGLGEVNRSLGREEGDARILALANTIQAVMSHQCTLFRGNEAELIAVCEHQEEKDVLNSVMEVVNACKSTVIFGIGSVGGAAPDRKGTMLQALEEAQCSLRIKKMLHSDSTRSQALNSLVRALEETDAETEAHVQRTQRMGEALGRKIGMSDAQLTKLKLLCLLHDIGKITVPLEILNKPGKLTDAEWAMLRSHAEKGYQIAMASDELKPIAEMIRYHHERWDGHGYPAKLAKEEIPILSRIIALVDAYDAMVNDRSYRKALLPEIAQKEIRDNGGTQFDPYLAIEFLSLLEEAPEFAAGSKTGGGEVRVFEETSAQDAAEGNTSPVNYSKYFLDIEERIIEADAAFEKMTGYGREDIERGLSQFDLIPPEDREQYIIQVKNQFAKGEIAYLRHRILCRDGTIKHVICNGERYYDSSVKAFRSTILVFEV